MFNYFFFFSTNLEREPPQAVADVLRLEVLKHFEVPRRYEAGVVGLTAGWRLHRARLPLLPPQRPAHLPLDDLQRPLHLVPVLLTLRVAGGEQGRVRINLGSFPVFGLAEGEVLAVV